MSKDFKFEPIETHSLVVELTKRLLNYILSGNVRPGEKIPAERPLSEALGVGRSAIREAIKALSVLGILEVRQGYGTYVKQTSSSLLTQSIEWGLLLGEKHTMDLVEARMLFEVDIARLAAQRWEGSELDELRDILARMKNASLSEFVDADVQFHMKLCDMAKNTVLKNVLSSIRTLLRTWIQCVIDKAGETAFSYEDHHAIYLAVSERDPDAAARAMEHHMSDASKRLIEVLREADEADSAS
ncbi:Probable transcriptional regulator YvfI [Thermobacillus xylanilyticus]|uniref:Probable transcriptional regulator YvfI n=1 Tax=Thermobacillus xylanilyticus TaxID=76633 RepID=A0ABM8V0Z6_THEXY|nr:FadR/GntR family transcriptional regulator [Thermobacillus xylanilyticus]CAG5080051.1 Probable transcriptional regulator YvfI [Thermobacillus xylanilyticus]